MNDTVNWPTYLRTIADGDTGTLISQKTGIPDSTISRWLSGEVTPRPNQVVTVARTYGEHPIPALIAAGYLTPEEVDLASITPRRLQLREFTELEIAEEMVRRIAEGESSIIEAPLDGDHPAMRNVSPIRKDAKSRRSAEPAPAVDADAPVDIVNKRPQIAAQNPPRTEERARGARLEKVREKKPTKKAALTDPEMNTDETYD